MIILEQGVKDFLISYLNTYIGFLESFCSEETKQGVMLARNNRREHILRINISHAGCSLAGLSEVTENDEVVNLGQLILAVNRSLLERVGGSVTLQLSKKDFIFIRTKTPFHQSRRRGG
jgi:hypothetical protein